MSLKILLADDSMTAQNMGKKILQDAGYEVTAVSNGAAAMKKINAGQFDLLLLDVVMPGYTGPEVCAKARDLKGYAKTPILFTIGKMEIGTFKIEDAPKLKGDGVIIKPFEASDLITAVQKITGGAAPAKTVPTVPPEAEKTTRITPITEDTDQSFAQWSATAEQHTEDGMEPAATAAAVPAVEMSAAAGAAAAFDEAAVAPAFETPPAAPAFDLSTPAYESPMPEAPAFGSPEAAAIPLEAAPPAAPLDFGLMTTPEPEHVGPVAPAPGLELTAAEPVHVHVETAPELEIHSRDDKTPVSVDPNFESDRTRMVTDFATKFSGAGEAVPVGVAPEVALEAAPELATPELAAPELATPELEVAPSNEETSKLTPWVTAEAPVFSTSPEPGKIVSFAPPEQLAEFLSRPVDETPVEEVHAEVAPEPSLEPAVVEAAPSAVAQELEQAIASAPPEEPAPAVEVAPPPATLEASLEQALQPEAAAPPVEAQPEPVAAEPEPKKPAHDLEFAQALEAAIANAPEAPAEPHHEEAPQEQAKAAAASALAAAVARATPAEAPAEAAAAGSMPELEGVDPKIIAHAIERVLANAKSQILEEVLKELKK